MSPKVACHPRTAWVALRVDHASQQPVAPQDMGSLLQHRRALKSGKSTLPWDTRCLPLGRLPSVNNKLPGDVCCQQLDQVSV